MTLTVIPNLIQGSDEWLEARRGIVTASVVGDLLATRKLGAIDYPCACGAAPNDPCRSKTKPGETIKTLHPERGLAARDAGITVIEVAHNESSKGLTARLVAERITGWTDPTFISIDMERGMDDEPIAREKYSKLIAPVKEVGFMVEDRWGFQIGYSPDGLVGSDGLIEVKSRKAKIHLSTILADAVPMENMAQLQTALLVTGRQWIDYVSFCGGMPLWTKRVFPQPEWFEAITDAVAAFEIAATDMTSRYAVATAGLHPTERTAHITGELKL